MGRIIVRPRQLSECGRTMKAGETGEAGDSKQHRATAWHQIFGALLGERGPAAVQIQAEPTLSAYPRRPDFLLLRRPATEVGRDAQILRGLWPRLARASLVELKSPARDFRKRELVRLLGYGVQYHEQHLDDLAGPGDLSLVLVMLRPTPSLHAEIAHMGWSLQPLEPGYARIAGVMYTTFVVFTDEVTVAEDDDFIRIFSHHPVQRRETRWWLEQWLERTKSMNEPHQDPSDLEGYDEVLRKLLESLPPEERLIGLSPEQRVAGLGPEERLLTLPDEALRALSDEYLRTLSPATQAILRARIGRPLT
jgi:hypothetical protein